MAEVFYYDYVTIKPWTYFLTASEFGLTMDLFLNSFRIRFNLCRA